jgi:GABA permease
MLDPHRILVVANRTCPCPALLHEIAQRSAEHEAVDVLLIAPALNTRLRHYLSDVDPAVADAHQRLKLAHAGLAELGMVARSEVGDPDPHTAIADALARFPATEIIVSTLPPGQSNWLERGLIERARRDFDVPVTHLVSRYGGDTAQPTPA